MRCRGASCSTVLGDNFVEGSFPKFVSKPELAVVSKVFRAALYFKGISDSVLESIGPGSVGKFSCGKKSTAWRSAVGLQ